MNTIPLTLREANKFVANHHRHNLPVIGCKFAIGAIKDEKLVGVAICGRPVGRLLDNGLCLEVLRTCTDGTRNANSFLYGKVRQIAAAMGYEKVITYTLKCESGASLKAIGAKIVDEPKPHEWSNPNRPRIHQQIYEQEKFRWEL